MQTRYNLGAWLKWEAAVSRKCRIPMVRFRLKRQFDSGLRCRRSDNGLLLGGSMQLHAQRKMRRQVLKAIRV